MTQRIYNFSAGPATMPVSVLEEAKENMLSLGETGIGIMEHSHRSKAFDAVMNETVALGRELAGLPEDYELLFMQGGASGHFANIPMNFLKAGQTADYILTGSWASKAYKEAKVFGNTNEASSSKDKNFSYLPETHRFSEAPAYVHMTSNNTIFGTQFHEVPDVPAGTPIISDASSDIFCRPVDVTKYGMIYAGAQKNLGPSGVVMLIASKELIDSGRDDIAAIYQYRTHAEKNSLYHTPPTFAIYCVGLVFKWIKAQGGLAAMETHNKEKAAILYDYLASSDLFITTAEESCRSLMNVTFVTGDDEKDAAFVKAATAEGFDGLKGHRSVGGMRASIYNAFPKQGVTDLVAFMKDFEAKNA